MKKIYLALCLMLFSALSYSQAFEGSKQVFQSPQLKSMVAQHKTVAILPYEVSITYKKQPKNLNAEADRNQEKTMSKSIQSSMYTYLLRKSKDYSVTFQDVDKTNILLKKAGMLDKMDEFTKDEIA